MLQHHCICDCSEVVVLLAIVNESDFGEQQ